MENLETVVRERNKAYYLLETGETGERPGRVVHNQLGLRFYYRYVKFVSFQCYSVDSKIIM